MSLTWTFKNRVANQLGTLPLYLLPTGYLRPCHLDLQKSNLEQLSADIINACFKAAFAGKGLTSW